MAAKNKDHTRWPRGGADQATTLQPCFPLQRTRRLRAVTQHYSVGPQRSALRLRDNLSGKNDLYDGLGTASVAKADLVRCRPMLNSRAVCAEMSSPTNDIAESGV